MLERYASYYLNLYLGKYVRGLDKDKLRLGLFSGNVELTDLQLNPDALKDLELPISIDEGRLGKLTLRVPYMSLGKEPVVVEFDRVYVLCRERDDSPRSHATTAQDLLAEKLRRIAEAEDAFVRAMKEQAQQVFKAEQGKSEEPGYWSALLQTVLSNIQVVVTHLHVRYEDTRSLQGHTVALGLTLRGLKAVTVDEAGTPVFAAADPSGRMRKMVSLDRLAVYCDLDGGPQAQWRPKKLWKEMNRDDWDRWFLPGIVCRAGSQTDGPVHKEPGTVPKSHLLEPLTLTLLYLRRGSQERVLAGDALHEASLSVDSLRLRLGAAHFAALTRIADAVSMYQRRLPHAQLRPSARPGAEPGAARQWWRYAAQVALKRRLGTRISWEAMQKAVVCRRLYVQQYFEALERGGDPREDVEIRRMDAELEEGVALLFRKLAQARWMGEQARRGRMKKEQEAQARQSWMGWLGSWVPANTAARPSDAPELSDREVGALQDLVRQHEEAQKAAWADRGKMVVRVDAAVAEAAVSLSGRNGAELAQSRASGFFCRACVFPERQQGLVRLVDFSLVGPRGVIIHGSEKQAPAALPAPAPEGASGMEVAGKDTSGKGASGKDIGGKEAVHAGVKDAGAKEPAKDAAKDAGGKGAGAKSAGGKNGGSKVAGGKGGPRGKEAGGGDGHKGRPAPEALLEGPALAELVLAASTEEGTGVAVYEVGVTVAPSFVALDRRTMDEVLAFFSVDEEVDQSPLTEQATATYQSARDAALASLKAAGLEERPRLRVCLDWAAPRVALIATPRPGADRVPAVLVNLGRFQLVSDSDAAAPLNLPARARPSYELFTFASSDTSLHVTDLPADGRFSWRDVGAPFGLGSGIRSGDLEDKGSHGLPQLTTVLEDFGMHAAVGVSPAPAEGLAAVKLHVEAPALTVHAGPGAIEGVMRVVTDMTTATTRPRWLEQTTLSGPLRVLQRAGYRTGVTRWEPSVAVLKGSTLYILPSLASPTYSRAVFLGRNVRVTRLAPAASAGQRNLLAIHDASVPPSHCIASRDALVLQAPTEAALGKWAAALIESRRSMADVATTLEGRADFEALATPREGRVSSGAWPGTPGTPGVAKGALGAGAGDAPIVEVTARMGACRASVRGPRGVVRCAVIEECVRASAGAAGVAEGDGEGVAGESGVLAMTAVGVAGALRVGARSLRVEARVGQAWVEDLVAGRSGQAETRLALASRGVAELDAFQRDMPERARAADERATATQALLAALFARLRHRVIRAPATDSAHRPTAPPASALEAPHPTTPPVTATPPPHLAPDATPAQQGQSTPADPSEDTDEFHDALENPPSATPPPRKAKGAEKSGRGHSSDSAASPVVEEPDDVPPPPLPPSGWAVGQGSGDNAESGGPEVLRVVYEALDPSHPMFDDKEGTVEVDLWGVTVDVHRPLLAAGLASLTANLDALFAGMEAAPPEEGAEATRGSGGGDDDGVAGMPGSPGSPQAGAEGAEGAGQGEGFGSRAEELPAWMVRRSAVRTDVRVHEGSLCVRHEGPGARPLAVMTVQGWTVSADLRYTSLDTTVTVADVVAEDCALPEGHPCRQVVALSQGLTQGQQSPPGSPGAPLASVSFKIHQPWDASHRGRVPQGRQHYSLSVNVRAVDVVFLHRFYQECLTWLYGFLEMWTLAAKEYRPRLGGGRGANDGDGAGAQGTGQLASPRSQQEPSLDTRQDSSSAAAAPMLLLLDVDIDAPVITVPRDSAATDWLELDLGKLTVRNRVGVLEGTGADMDDPGAVLVDAMDLSLTQVSVRAVAGGVFGPKILQGDTSIQVKATRLLLDRRASQPVAPAALAPQMCLDAVIEGATAALRDDDLAVISAVIAENFAEPLQLPEGTYFTLGGPVPDTPAHHASRPCGATDEARSSAGDVSLLAESHAPQSQAPVRRPSAPGAPLGAPRSPAEAMPRSDTLTPSGPRGASTTQAALLGTLEVRGMQLDLLQSPRGTAGADAGRGPARKGVRSGGADVARGADGVDEPTPLRPTAGVTGGDPVARTLPLASVVVAGARAAVRQGVDGSLSASVLLPTLRVIDARPDVPAARRLVLSAAPGPGAATPSESPSPHAAPCLDAAPLVAVLVDASPGMSPLSARVRLQRPLVFTDPSFLVAVADFLLPLGPRSAARPKGAPDSLDLVLRPGRTRLSGPLHLSRAARLVTDPWAPEGSEFVLDGAGFKVFLPETVEAPGAAAPCIVVGAGHTLRVTDATVMNGHNLSACLSLAPGARLAADVADGARVVPRRHKFGPADFREAVEGRGEAEAPGVAGDVLPGDVLLPWAVVPALDHRLVLRATVTEAQVAMTSAAHEGGARGERAVAGGAGAAGAKVRVAVDVVGLALGLALETRARPAATGERRVVRWEADLGARYAQQGAEVSVDCRVGGLQAASLVLAEGGGDALGGMGREPSGAGGPRDSRREDERGGIAWAGTWAGSAERGLLSRQVILEPVDLTLAYHVRTDVTDVSANIGPVRLSVNLDLLDRILALQEEVLASLSPPPAAEPLAPCGQFALLFCGEDAAATDAHAAAAPPPPSLSFWRPQPPSGYCALGDVASAGPDPPPVPAAAVSMASGLAAHPLGFHLVWPPPEPHSLSTWAREAPLVTRAGMQGADAEVAWRDWGGAAPPLALWAPQPPPGYCALGCVASADGLPPAETSVACILASAADPCASAAVLFCGTPKAAGAGAVVDAASMLAFGPPSAPLAHGGAESAGLAGPGPAGAHAAGHSGPVGRGRRSAVTVWAAGTDAGTFWVGEASRGHEGRAFPGRVPPVARLAHPPGATPEQLWNMLQLTEQRGLAPAGSWAKLCASRPRGRAAPAQRRPGSREWAGARVHLYMLDRLLKAGREREGARGAGGNPAEKQLFGHTAEFRLVFWEPPRSDVDPASVASLWRPVVPHGFGAVGDCLSFGGKEPPAACLLLNMERLGDLVARPTGFHLLFRDDIRHVYVWAPDAPPGYLAVGCMVTTSLVAPRALDYCVVVSELAQGTGLNTLRAWRPGARALTTMGYLRLEAFLLNERTHSFTVRTERLVGPMQRLTPELDEVLALKAPRPPQAASATPQRVELLLPDVSVVLGDLSGAPVLDVCVLDGHAGANRLPSGLLTSVARVAVEAWAYNAPAREWEPVVERWDVVSKTRYNPQSTEEHSVAPGLHATIESGGDKALHLTAAFRTADALLRTYAEWAEARFGQQSEAAGRGRLGAKHRADEAASARRRETARSVDVLNATGVPLRLRVFDGNGPAGVSERPLAPGSAVEAAAPARTAPPRRAMVRPLRAVLALRVTRLEAPAAALALPAVAPGTLSADVLVTCGVDLAVLLPDSNQRAPILTAARTRTVRLAPAALAAGRRASADLGDVFLATLAIDDPGARLTGGAVRPCLLRVTARAEGTGGVLVELGECVVDLDRDAIAEGVAARLAGTGQAPRKHRVSAAVGRGGAVVECEVWVEDVVEGGRGGGRAAAVGARALAIEGEEDIQGLLWGVLPALGDAGAAVGDGTGAGAKGGARGKGVKGESGAAPAQDCRAVQVGSQVLLLERAVRDGRAVDVVSSRCRVTNTAPFDVEVMVLLEGNHEGQPGPFQAAYGSRDSLSDYGRWPSSEGGAQGPGHSRAGSEVEAHTGQREGRGRARRASGPGVFVVPPPESGEPRDELEVFENQRFKPLRGWGGRGFLLPFDSCRPYSHAFPASSNDFPQVALPAGWRWEGPWEAEVHANTDADGWAYSISFQDLSWPPTPHNAVRRAYHFVRRRRWVRRRVRVVLAGNHGHADDEEGDESASATDVPITSQLQRASEAASPGYLGVLSPGESASVPLQFLARNAASVVLLRPREPPGGPGPASEYEWGAAQAGSADSCVDLTALVPGGFVLLHCARLPPPGAPPNARSPPQRSRSTAFDSHVWLALECVRRMHQVHGGGGGRAVPSWDLVIGPPLEVANYLPVPLAFTLLGAGAAGDSALAQAAVGPGDVGAVFTVNPMQEMCVVVEPQGHRFAAGSPIKLPAPHTVVSAGSGSLAVEVAPAASPEARYEIGFDWQVVGGAGEEAAAPAGRGGRGRRGRGRGRGRGAVSESAAGAALFRRVRMTVWAPLVVRNALDNPVEVTLAAWPARERSRGRGGAGPSSSASVVEEAQGEGGEGAASLPLVSLATHPHPEGTRSVVHSTSVVPAGRVGLLSFPTVPEHEFGVVLRLRGTCWSPVVGHHELTSMLLRLDTLPESRLGGTLDLIAHVSEGRGASKLAYELLLLPSAQLINRSGLPLHFQVLAARPVPPDPTRPAAASGAHLAAVPAISGVVTPDAVPVPLLWSVTAPDCVGMTLALDPRALPGGRVQAAATGAAPALPRPAWEEQGRASGGAGPSVPETARTSGGGGVAPSGSVSGSVHGREGSALDWAPPLDVPFMLATSSSVRDVGLQVPESVLAQATASAPGDAQTHASGQARAVGFLHPLSLAELLSRAAKRARGVLVMGASVSGAWVMVTVRVGRTASGVVRVEVGPVAIDPLHIIVNATALPASLRPCTPRGRLPPLRVPPMHAAGVSWQVPGAWPVAEVALQDDTGAPMVHAPRTYILGACATPTGGVPGDADVESEALMSLGHARLEDLASADEVGGVPGHAAGVRADVMVAKGALLSYGPEEGASASEKWAAAVGGPRAVTQVLVLQPAGAATLESRAPKAGPATPVTLHVAVAAMDLSVIDQQLQELVLVSVTGVQVHLRTGLGIQASTRLRASLHSLQVDNMLRTAHPVALHWVRPEPCHDAWPAVSVSVQHTSTRTHAVTHVPFLLLQVVGGPHLMIDEPLVWRLFSFSNSLAAVFPSAGPTTAAAASDPVVRLGILRLEPLPAVITFSSDESTRPQSFRAGLAGLGLGISMAFANLEQVRLRLLGVTRGEQLVRQSALVAGLWRHITRQLLSQWSKVLFAASWGKGATRVLDHFASVVSGLAMDQGFRPQGAQRGQVTDLASGVAAGGESLAKGVWRGVTGLLTKPMEGAAQQGFRGFARGVAKGLVGVVTQPVSGAIDLVSRTAEGALGTVKDIKETLGAAPAVPPRKRLPRVVTGDGVARPYSHAESVGAAVVLAMFEQQAAMAASLPEARVDAATLLAHRMAAEGYEWHMVVTHEQILVATNLRVALVRAPDAGALDVSGNDPRLLRVAPMWEAPWVDVLALELRMSPSAGPGQPPDVLVLHLKGLDLASAEDAGGWILSGLLGQEGGEGGAGATLSRAVGFKTGTNRAVVARRVLQIVRRRHAQDTWVSDHLVAPHVSRAPPLGSAAAPADAPVSDSPPGSPQLCPGRLPCLAYRLQWRGDQDYRTGRPPLSVWRPVPPAGYSSVGDVLVYGHQEPEQPVYVMRDDVELGTDAPRLAAPVDFLLVWRDASLPGRAVTLWEPVPPPGYVALGCVAVPRLEEPRSVAVRCVREDLCFEAAVAGGEPIWAGESGDPSRWRVGLWGVDNDSCTFVATRARPDGVISRPGRVFGALGSI